MVDEKTKTKLIKKLFFYNKCIHLTADITTFIIKCRCRTREFIRSKVVGLVDRILFVWVIKIFSSIQRFFYIKLPRIEPDLYVGTQKDRKNQKLLFGKFYDNMNDENISFRYYCDNEYCLKFIPGFLSYNDQQGIRFYPSEDYISTIYPEDSPWYCEDCRNGC